MFTCELKQSYSYELILYASYSICIMLLQLLFGFYGALTMTSSLEKHTGLISSSHMTIYTSQVKNVQVIAFIADKIM